MSSVRVIVVTGLPGSGKTTLARELAARWRLPLIAKDLIKEPLLDVLGADDAAQSRRLSDASFAVLFDVARELVAAGVSCVLEGNFRAGEHEAPLLRALDSHAGTQHSAEESSASGERLPTLQAFGIRIAQVLCRVPESERLARLQARTTDPARHAGHRLGELSGASASGDSFLAVPSERFVHPGAGGHTVHASLENWMNLRAPSR